MYMNDIILIYWGSSLFLFRHCERIHHLHLQKNSSLFFSLFFFVIGTEKIIYFCDDIFIFAQLCVLWFFDRLKMHEKQFHSFQSSHKKKFFFKKKNNSSTMNLNVRKNFLQNKYSFRFAFICCKLKVRHV